MKKPREQHGLTNTPEYRVWTDMRTRCNNKNATSYDGYGGRGIKCCQRWDSFTNFLSDMGKKPSPIHTIERIDVNGGYEPMNCKWATKEAQAANKRNTIRKVVDGETKRIPELASDAGISRSGMWLRVKRGTENLTRGSKRNGWLTFNGVTDTYVGWAKRTGLKRSTIAMRITRYGWSVQQALTKGASL